MRKHSFAAIPVDTGFSCTILQVAVYQWVVSSSRYWAVHSQSKAEEALEELLAPSQVKAAALYDVAIPLGKCSFQPALE
jgi:hypothetical protein